MSSLANPRILLVEDSEDDALLLFLELRRSLPEASMQRVENEAALAAALGSGDWDLVICDHAMPGFDSWRALELTNRLGNDIPFVIYSGNLDRSVALDAMRSGAQDFIDKNDPARLVPVIERELRNAQLRRAKREADSSIIRLSKYDTLTRLPNRESLDDAMRAGLLAAPGANLQPALLVLDLDRFMRINESFGYAAGDQLIRQVAMRLQASAGTALVSRLGQDEFAVFLPRNRDPDNAIACAERIERAFSQPFMLETDEIYLSFSMGLARFPDDGDDPQALLRNAESAMFRAKRQGGARVQVYDRRINRSVGYRLKLENALRGVVARGELSVLYQPVVDLNTCELVATEALVRWNHPEFGSVPPDQFIPLAEEAGLILEIGDWVTGQACTQTQRWREEGHSELKVAVNISAQQFLDRSLAERVQCVVAQSGLSPSALELEITESVAMRDAASAVTILKALKAQGMRIAIDDFGTGFSSLSYLKRFPIDILKVDKSFVSGLPGDEEDIAIVRMIAALGQTLGLVLHGEGVESDAQLQMLRRLGIQRAQGYAVARPMAAAEAGALLTAYAAQAPGRRWAGC